MCVFLFVLHVFDLPVLLVLFVSYVRCPVCLFLFFMSGFVSLCFVAFASSILCMLFQRTD